MKVDIKFIARKAGVSIATVSRVLNHTKSVSPELTARVLAATEQHDYRPNRIAQGLILNKTQLLGVVVPNISGPYHARLLESIEAAAEQHGYGVLIVNVGREASFDHEMRSFSILHERGVDGVILLHENSPHEIHELCRVFPRPIVLASVNVPQCSLSWVGIDEEAAAFDAVSHLLALGHRCIGAILSGGYSLSILRKNGYVRALSALYDPDCVAFSECSMESGARAAELLTSRRPDLTAIFCVSDEIAIGAIQRLTRHGQQIPNDLSVVGFDDIDIGTIVTPQLSTIHQPVREIGTRAAELLFSVIDGRNDGCQRILLPHSLITRESTGPPPTHG